MNQIDNGEPGEESARQAFDTPPAEENGTPPVALEGPAALPHYVVFDTETTGLLDNSLPADHPSQPRLAHLAMIFLDSDLQVEDVLDLYVKPDGWVMPPEAERVNGLSTEFLEQVGVPIAEVLDAYEKAIKDGRVTVCHNAQFDCKMMRGELRRAGRPDLFEQTPNICTMRAFKAWRKIFKGYNLVAACAYFKIPYEKAHRATADAVACKNLFIELRKVGAVPDPKVYYSRHYHEIQARGDEYNQDPGPSFQVVE